MGLLKFGGMTKPPRENALLGVQIGFTEAFPAPSSVWDIFRTMEDIAMKLLDLQSEYQGHEDATSAASQFNKPEWTPRPKQVIAAEYAVTLANFLNLASTQ